MRSPRSQLALAVGAHVLVLAVGIVPLWSAHLFGWIAADEGYLNSAAARFADGEVPHRDFVERFPGALVVWNAASRALFGESFAGPRRGLLLASVLLLVLLHDLARRVLPAPAAAAVALAASSFGVPKWFASNPTWYVVLLGLAGARLLWCGFRSGRWGWFVGAGVCAAGAVAFKQTAGAFVTAALLSAVAVEACERGRIGGASALDRLAAGAAALSLPLVLQLVLLRHGGLYYPLLLVLAPAVVAAAVCVAATRGTTAAGTARRTGLVAAGVFLGTVPLLVYYAVHGALLSAFNGVVMIQWGAALRHFLQYVGLSGLPPLLKVLVWLGAGAVAGAAPLRIGRYAPLLPLALSAALAWRAGGALGAALELGAREVIMFLPAATAATAAAAIWRGRRLGLEGLLAVLCAGVFAVVYPLGAFLYAWYTAPVSVLAAALLARRAYGPWPVAAAAVAAFAIAVAFPPGADQVDGGPGADRSAVVLDGAGGGLRAPAEEGQALRAIAERVRALTEPGEPIFTYPADFGVYALADRPNPTPHMWVDFYAGAEDFREILATLDRENVRVIVVRSVMPIKNPHRKAFLEEINARYRPTVQHPPYAIGERYDRNPEEVTPP
jgi:hypothetical protein